MDVKSDFPVLEKEIVYLDSACMSLRPQCVIDEVVSYYSDYGACSGRSMHELGIMTARKVEGARSSLAEFVGVNPDAVVFTKNTTESLNLLACSLSLSKGDTVLTSDIEHNSNLVPWQMREGIRHKVFFTENGRVNLDHFAESVKGVKVVSVVHTSNFLGTTLPVREMAKISHEAGATFVLDAAQSVPHMPVDFSKLGVDFAAFSVHKMCGPTGVGVLYGKNLEDLSPFMVGGDTVSDTTYESFTLRKPPHLFEAGLQNYAGIIGGGAAAEYLMKVGTEKIHRHEKKLSAMMRDGLSPLVKLVSTEDSCSIATFTSKANAHDIAMVLSSTANVFVRSGQMCAHSWFNAHGIDSAVRASTYLYNTKEDISVLTETLESVLSEL